MPKEIASYNHESLSLSEKGFVADVQFQKSNLPIIFNERHRLIHENCKTTISWGWGEKAKVMIALINLQTENCEIWRKLPVWLNYR
jgi:hypothetical protein